MPEDLIQQMSKEGFAMQRRQREAIRTVTGEPEMDSDELTDLYLRANFEQRLQMFTQIYSDNEVGGLRMIGEIWQKASERLAGED